MSYRSFPVILAGGSFKSRSKPLSSQFTQNLIPEAVEQGKVNFVLHPYPGLKLWSTAPVAGKDRGAHQMSEELYRVVGTTLYKVNAGGSHVKLGSIPGNGRCIFANDGDNLFITTGGGDVYRYDGTTLAIVSDANIKNSLSVTFLNNQFIYNDSKFFKVSDVGDGSTVNSLNIAGAESNPDDLLRAYAFQQQLYLMGKRTIEPYYNSGAGSPPFDRIDTQIFEVGLGAINSVASNDRYMYWLGDDNRVYRATGGLIEKVSNRAVAKEISRLTTPSDAIGYTYTFDDENYYKLTFPTDNVTFDFKESLGINGWFNTSSDLSSGMYRGTSMIRVYNKNLVMDKDNGKIYELDRDTFTEDGDTVQRIRVTSSINSRYFGLINKRIQMSKMRFNLETGTGLISGQGEDPQIRVEYSTDGGRSWTEGSWINTGMMGEHNIVVEWHEVVSFYDMMVRLTYTDPVGISIYDAWIDLRLAGY